MLSEVWSSGPRSLSAEERIARRIFSAFYGRLSIRYLRVRLDEGDELFIRQVV